MTNRAEGPTAPRAPRPTTVRRDPTIERRIPVRTCIGCRTRRPWHLLVRVTRSDDADIVVAGPSDGRGAWLCRADDQNAVGACLDAALARQQFGRAWRTTLRPGDDETIRTAVRRRESS